MDEERIEQTEMSEPEEHPDKPSAVKEILSWLLWIAIPAVVVLLLNAYVVRPVRVSGDSMMPTLCDHDILFVTPLKAPERGDIIVFRDENGTALVKRVIALGGETVVLDYLSDAVFVDNRLIEEDYLNYAEDDPMEERSESEFSVPEGCVFVLGDNRNHSADSRSFGAVEGDSLLGVLVLRIPLGQWLSD